MDTLDDVAAFVAGLLIVYAAMMSLIRTLVLPRASVSLITVMVFRSLRVVFDLITGRISSYERRDSIMALYGPLALLTLAAVWLALVGLGYTLLFYAVGVDNLHIAYRTSGSSLLTLGFVQLHGPGMSTIGFTEAAIGLGLLAILIAYLPTIYGAFERRETAVTLLATRAGEPPWAVTMIERYHRIAELDRIHDIWNDWEEWFAELEESHTSLPVIAFFRSPLPTRSWVVAAGTVLDCAALTLSTLDIGRVPQAALCLRAGFLSLRRITDYFGIPYNDDPDRGDPISITREEFDEAYDRLAAQDVPVRPNRELAWEDFRGWRVNYDEPLLILAALTMAPVAPWVSDRSRRVTRRRGVQPITERQLRRKMSAWRTRRGSRPDDDLEDDTRPSR